MDQSPGVGGGQPGGDLQADAQDLLQRQWPAAVELVLQGGAVDELHDQVGHRASVLDGVNGDDVVVA